MAEKRRKSLQIKMISIWEKQSFSSFDYLIVGGGLVGLSTAASLIEQNPNAKIAVLERGSLPTGASTKNAGFACFGSATELLSEIYHTNTDAMLARVERRWRGLQLLKQRLGAQNIGLENKGGYELIPYNKTVSTEQIQALNQSLKAIFPSEVFTEVNQKITAFGFESTWVKQLIYNPFEAQIDTGMMMRSLQKYVQERGVLLLFGTEVKHLQMDFQHQVSLETMANAQTTHFAAPKVAICTNAFTPTLLPQLKITPGRGQVLLTSPLKNLKFKGTFHFEEGYYYFRDLGKCVLFGGGRNQDFEAETTTDFDLNPKIQADLIQKLRQIILPNTPFEITHQWTGIMGFTSDHNPIVEEVLPQVFVGAGLNGMGVAIGSLVGQELANLMCEQV